MEKGCEIHQEEREKMIQTVCDTSQQIFTINTRGTVPPKEAMLQTGKAQTGKKFIET